MTTTKKRWFRSLHASVVLNHVNPKLLRIKVPMLDPSLYEALNSKQSYTDHDVFRKVSLTLNPKVSILNSNSQHYEPSQNETLNPKPWRRRNWGFGRNCRRKRAHKKKKTWRRTIEDMDAIISRSGPVRVWSSRLRLRAQSSEALKRTISGSLKGSFKGSLKVVLEGTH